MSSGNSSDSENEGRIYTPGPNINEKLGSLKAAIVNRPPFCSGTVPLDASDLKLFYEKPSTGDATGDNPARSIDLTKATEVEMQRLVDVCEVATFGVNREEVLDPSYRSAWKLDPTNFTTKLNILHAGLMDSIRYNLLSSDQGNQTFFAELYKLNIYGKGSFFKAHKDTPRGDKMFGSLVVVLPTAHEGGTLILRHGESEWKFESDTVAPSSITYAAFYGDVEHEVAEVKSGFRLTLTYNLYFGESLDSQSIVSTPTARTAALFTSLPPNAETFQNKLAELLADDTFLPMGGRLGFGLFHEYPFATKPDLERLTEVLKGSDAVIMQACRALGLSCVLNVCYEGDEDEEYRTVALCDFVPNLEGDYMETQVWEYLSTARYLGGKAILANSQSDESIRDSGDIELDGRDDRLPCIDIYVHWVTKQTSHNAIKSHLISYGNEPSLSVDYGRVCLIVSVGPPGSRGAKPVDV
ncbi:hypothetical protein SCHPADRAFT_905680 [Schizopora paradoxa]|uniref:Prolyl 4-hydroxylase alpha subunit Fe(2+) 2OG dioxygenase domain-containing protein n=1 Tax=Schizopora paradoxa TaxID=27342 RepID=A0A0H2RII4_9AGAM|nr:hypothetical protein SCHPADRAFT_905680 [Schizopora paradoxa]